MQRNSADGNRYYEIEGNSYPSVTSILSVISKPALIAWAAKQGSLENMRKKQAQALSIGSEAHKLIEIYLKTPDKVGEVLETASDGAKRAYENFLDWSGQAKFRIIHSEFVCYSKKHGYAGTADGVAEIDGKLAIIDWKTSSGCWDEYFLQTEAYLRAIDEMVDDGLLKLPGKLEDRVILRLPKAEADFYVHKEPKSMKDFMYFLSALDLWNGVNDMKARYGHHRKNHGKS